MESLYKRKGRVGLANREKRNEVYRQTSKAKKEEVIDSRRRMPLGELNVADPCKDASDSKKTKSEARLQQLREWQKARQEAKAKAKKPAFVPGKSQSTGFKPQLNTAEKEKGKSLFPENNVSNTKSTLPSTATKPASSAKRPLSSKKNLDRPDLIPPKLKTARPARKTQPANKDTRSAVQQPKKTRPPAKTQSLVKTQPVSRVQRPKPSTEPVKAKKPLQEKSKQTSSKDKKRAPVKQTRSSRDIAVRQSSRLASKQDPPSPNNHAASPQPLVIEVPPPPSTPNKKSYKPVCPSPLLQSRSASYRANSESAVDFVEDPAWIPGACAPEGSVSDQFEAFKDSFSPFKFGNSESNFQFSFKKDAQMQPPCSPTLVESSSSSACVDKKSGGPRSDSSENDEERLTGSSPGLSFDSLTITSPSRHGRKRAGKSLGKVPVETRRSSHGKRRRSRMVLKYEEEKEEEQKEEVEALATDNLASASPLQIERVAEEKSIGNEVESVTEDSGDVTMALSPGKGKRRRSQIQLKHEEGELSETPNISVKAEEVPSNTEDITDGIDIARFRKLHSDVCEKLVSLCETWEAKMRTLEESEGDMEEVLGQIRTTTGSGQLMMKQKLKQYMGLVDTAETQSGHRKTTAEDLQGFWDMVYYQVDVLFKMFADLDELEKNNWTAPQPSPKKPRLQKKSRNAGTCKAKKEPGNEANNERQQAARKKMMEQRAEFKRLRMKARQQAKEEAEGEVVNEVKQEETAMKEEEEEEAGGKVVKEVEQEEEAVKEETAMKEEEEVAGGEVVKEVEQEEAVTKEVSLNEETAMKEEAAAKEELLNKELSCSEDVQLYELPLKKRQLDEAVYPSPLRRSARLRDRSVFSPMCSPVLQSRRQRVTPRKEPPHPSQEGVPTGLLITF